MTYAGLLVWAVWMQSVQKVSHRNMSCAKLLACVKRGVRVKGLAIACCHHCELCKTSAARLSSAEFQVHCLSTPRQSVARGLQLPQMLVLPHTCSAVVHAWFEGAEPFS